LGASPNYFSKALSMIDLAEFFEFVGGQIHCGGPEPAYGPNAFGVTSQTNDYKISAVFDTKTQLVLALSAYDSINDRTYIYGESDLNATNYIVLEVYEDWLEKATAIRDGQDYDTRVQIPIDLDDTTLLQLFKLAHQEDVTFNEYVINVLKKQLGL
jgi:hypothetical protein